MVDCNQCEREGWAGMKEECGGTNGEARPARRKAAVQISDEMNESQHGGGRR